MDGVRGCGWVDGVRVTAVYDMRTALQAKNGDNATICAAYKGRAVCLRALIEGKADLDAKVRGGEGGGGTMMIICDAFVGSSWTEVRCHSPV